jgi:hypothetical protein
MSVGFIAWAVLGFVASAVGDGHVQPSYCRGTAKYRAYFTGTWEDGVQSDDFPANAMFSPFTFASHTMDYTMWRPMLMAEEGVKDVAETGNNTRLVYELNRYKEAGKVYDIQTTMGPTDPNGTAHAYVYTNTKFRLISMISMIFPSPDWFIGLYNIDMCVTDTAKWMGKRTINLYAWDAGTDSGKRFESLDDETDPAEYITLIMRTNDSDSSFPLDLADPENDYVAKFGQIVLELVEVKDGDAPVCYAHGEQSYHVNFQGLWTRERHPMDFPGTDAHFSPLVAASHNDDYEMWVPGKMASPGVQLVAETGNSSILQDELAYEYGYSKVLDYDVEDGPIVSNATMNLYVDVDLDHPYISAISMIFPSPDWFVGVSSINVCDGYFWKDGPIAFSLLPWDGGSDSGLTFKAADLATDPKAPISLITTDTMGAFYNRGRQHILPLGTIILERKKDAQRDYQNLLSTWKKAFADFQDQFEQWKNDECPSN